MAVGNGDVPRSGRIVGGREVDGGLDLVAEADFGIAMDVARRTRTVVDDCGRVVEGTAAAIGISLVEINDAVRGCCGLLDAEDVGRLAYRVDNLSRFVLIDIVAVVVGGSSFEVILADDDLEGS